MIILGEGMTHIGMKRSSNQDAIAYDNQHSVYVLADGMGGHNSGDVASSIAAKEILGYIIANLDADPGSTLQASIQNAGRLIYEKSTNDSKFQGMGTTATILYFKENTLYLGNVGDSRAYLINQNDLFQLTIDHSLVQQKIDLSIYSREEAARDPKKNVLVRTVGLDPEVDADVFTFEKTSNNLFLLCSDGLYGAVNDQDTLHIINQNIPDVQSATPQSLNKTCQELVQLANDNGGNDNISVILTGVQQ